MPYQETVQHKQYTRRTLVVGAAQVALLGALGARLYHLQVVEQDRYQLLAEENRINLRLLAPPRGRVLDRFGVELASNRRNYRLLLVAEEAFINDITPGDSVNQTIDLEILHFDLSEGEVTNSSLGVGKKDQVRGKIIETIDSTSVDDVLVNCEQTGGLGTGDNIGFRFVKNIIKRLKF